MKLHLNENEMRNYVKKVVRESLCEVMNVDSNGKYKGYGNRQIELNTPISSRIRWKKITDDNDYDDYLEDYKKKHDGTTEDIEYDETAQEMKSKAGKVDWDTQLSFGDNSENTKKIKKILSNLVDKKLKGWGKSEMEKLVKNTLFALIDGEDVPEYEEGMQLSNAKDGIRPKYAFMNAIDDIREAYDEILNVVGGNKDVLKGEQFKQMISNILNLSSGNYKSSKDETFVDDRGVERAPGFTTWRDVPQQDI